MTSALSHNSLADHLVRLSGLRRREDLLRTLTEALAADLPVEQVDVFSVVLDENQRYWMPLTRAGSGQPVRFVSDPMHTHLEDLVPVQAIAQRLQCLEQVSLAVQPPQPDRPTWNTCLPMVLADGASVWGVVELQSQDAMREDDLGIAKSLISMYCNMLDMLDYSECDALTGLFNRKPFEDLFYKVVHPVEEPELPPDGVEHRAVVTPSHFWLAMVDIDHFKQVNDTYGHLIGDEVLILVARLLKSAFRAYDRVYRFGGEEFVVVLRADSHDAAQAALERFRTAMQEHAFPQVGQKTASVGFTQILPGDTPSAACERADQAVYYAKGHGRNQVCSEIDLVNRGLLKGEAKVGDIELF